MVLLLLSERSGATKEGQAKSGLKNPAKEKMSGKQVKGSATFAHREPYLFDGSKIARSGRAGNNSTVFLSSRLSTSFLSPFYTADSGGNISACFDFIGKTNG